MVRKVYITYFSLCLALTALEVLGFIGIEHIMMSVLALLLILMMLTHAPIIFHPFTSFREINRSVEDRFDEVLISAKQFFWLILPLLIYIIVTRLSF